MVLSIFPEFLIYDSYAPLIVRLLLALIFIEFALHKYTRGKKDKAVFFEKIGLTPGIRYVFVFATLELLIGGLLVIGLYTQLAALGAVLILGTCAVIKHRRPHLLPSELRYYIVLCVIALSLLLTGAGTYAIDLPL